MRNKPKKITTLSPAKLNLFLHITDKRLDGYHNLQTVFRLLNWGDEMRFEVSSDEFLPHNGIPVRLHCNKHLTNNPMDNLIIKSAYALIETTRIENPLPVIDVYLDKNIPTGAGLGGGSSNSATTLMVLNQLWKLGLTSKELQEIGTKLGADVPIFIYAKDTGSAIAEGIGEIFTSIDIPKQQFLLLTPSAHISTAELFSHPKLKRNTAKLSITDIKKNQVDFVNQLNAPFNNVFQSVVKDLSYEVDEALAYLKMFEPLTNTTARMTGSGSCVFLPIGFDMSNELINRWFDDAPCDAYLVQSL